MQRAFHPNSARRERSEPARSSYVEILHAKIPGRTRFRIRGLSRSPHFGSRIYHFVARDRGFKVLSLSTTSSTLLVEHPHELSADTIRTELEEAVIRFCQFAARPEDEATSLKRTAQGNFHSESWFSMPPEKVARALEVSLKNGLDMPEAQRRLRTWGTNTESEPVPKSSWSLLMDQYHNLPSGLLAASAVVSLVTRARVDALLISGVLATNGAIGFLTERHTHRLISSLGGHRTALVPTVRKGMLMMLSSSELVPGDIVILEPGPVPADIRIVECEHLYTDESALTGESSPVLKSASTLSMTSTPLAERSNFLFTGTTVLSGHGRGIVVATGRYTEIGTIRELVSGLKPPPTPMQENLAEVGDLLVMTSVAACAALFLLGIARGLSGAEMLKTVISLAIAAVPEGLPTVGATTLALGIANMQKKDVFIRHLAAVENLGSVSVICFDKTGTLTLNQMSVTDIVMPSGHYAMEGKTILRDGIPLVLDAHNGTLQEPCAIDLNRLATVSVLCNDAEPGGDTTEGENPKYAGSFYGSPTEKALIRLGSQLGVVAHQIRQDFPRIQTLHRTESSMYMGTWHNTPTNENFIAVKGSPEAILQLCDSYLQEGHVLPLTDSMRTTFLADNHRLADQALRVLAIAEKKGSLASLDALVTNGFNDAAAGGTRGKGFTWLGLVGLKDPPRAGVGPLLAAFHAAGIRTNMITGDQESTAQAIGRDLGMNGTGSSALLPIFSRVSPSDKLHIIQALQAKGAVVAMTGDGVNDSPALRAADVGIAMGQGAGAAIDAAEVVLGEGNLETMLEAVRLGRTIRANLGKAIHFLIATNLSELLVTFTGVLLGRSHLLNPKQLLWINLLTDVFPAIGLAFEPAEPAVMQHPPLGRQENLFDRREWRTMGLEAVIMTTGSMTSYGLGWRLHHNEEEASTMAFFSLTVSQLLHALGSRHTDETIFSHAPSSASRANPWLAKAVNWSLLAQCATVLVPGMRSLIGNTRLGPGGWAIATLCGTFPFLMTQAIQSISHEKFNVGD